MTKALSQTRGISVQQPAFHGISAGITVGLIVTVAVAVYS